jgi:hypothetical protein
MLLLMLEESLTESRSRLRKCLGYLLLAKRQAALPKPSVARLHLPRGTVR